MLVQALWIAVAYVLGSVPWGLVIAKTFCGTDPRTDGSRSTGATNVSRLCGFGCVHSRRSRSDLRFRSAR